MTWHSFKAKGRAFLGRSFKTWSRADCSTQAAAISYFSALSLFPFVVVLITGIGLYFETFEAGVSAEKEVLKMLAEVFSPEMSASVAKLMASFQTQAQIGGPIALVVLLYLSSRVFTQIDRALGAVFERKTEQKRSLGRSAMRMATRRLRSIVVVLGYGVLVLLVFYGGAALSAVESFVKTWLPESGPVWGLRSTALNLGVTTILFGSMYRFFSRKMAHWKLAYGAGLLVAVLWAVGKGVVAGIVIGEKYTALGVIGSFLAILIWIYFNCIAFLSGAVLIRALADGERGEVSGDGGRGGSQKA